jgi:hypothetical protein
MNGNSTSSRRSFWGTVTWPRREGALILLACPAGFFVYGSLYGGVLYGVDAAVGIFPVLLVLWALHRIVQAWAEGPESSGGLSWLKAAVRYLFTDP